MGHSSPTQGPPRVVHVTTVHNPFDPRIFYKQLRSLREAGFDVHLVVPHEADETVDEISIHGLPIPRNRRDRLPLQRHVYRTARALDADLYQLHDPELLPLGVLLKKTTGARLVYDMHENYRSKGPLLGRVLRGLEHSAGRWLDHVLIAEDSYRPIVADLPVAHTYVPNYFVPIGEDDPTRCNGEEPGAPPTRLLYTGTVSASRGLRTMIDVANRIRRAGRPEVLRLVGVCHHADQRAWTEEQIRAEELGEVVERVGWNQYVPPTAIAPHYRWADVGLALCEPHPNHTGSLLTKFYEYLHYGLPLLCSDFPLWRDFVEQHDCGAVVPPNDPAAVLDVIDRWRARPDRYRQYARNARDAAAQYRWAPVGKRLAAIYRRLLETAERERERA